MSQKKQVPKDKSLESWIWDAACSIRGAKDAPKYKDYILPLIFTKRLCDFFDIVKAKATLHARHRDQHQDLFRTLLHKLMAAKTRVHDLTIQEIDTAL